MELHVIFKCTGCGARVQVSGKCSIGCKPGEKTFGSTLTVACPVCKSHTNFVKGWHDG